MASADIALEDAEPVTLYFPGDAGNVLVPVTRMVYSEPDINTAVVELCKGPSAASPLESVLPAGCGVIDVSVEDGVATVSYTHLQHFDRLRGHEACAAQSRVYPKAVHAPKVVRQRRLRDAAHALPRANDRQTTERLQCLFHRPHVPLNIRRAYFASAGKEYDGKNCAAGVAMV